MIVVGIYFAIAFIAWPLIARDQYEKESWPRFEAFFFIGWFYALFWPIYALFVLAFWGRR